MKSRLDWSRIAAAARHPQGHALVTLADVRELMRHLPEARRARPTWRQVAADIKAAAGGADVEGAAVTLRLVLMTVRFCKPLAGSSILSPGTVRTVHMLNRTRCPVPLGQHCHSYHTPSRFLAGKPTAGQMYRWENCPPFVRQNSPGCS